MYTTNAFRNSITESFKGDFYSTALKYLQKQVTEVLNILEQYIHYDTLAFHSKRYLVYSWLYGNIIMVLKVCSDFVKLW